MKIHFYLLFLLAACAGEQPKFDFSEKAILIENVNVVDVRDGSIGTATNVLIDSGKIALISSAQIDFPEDQLTINGTGKYLLPGLTEMHAHIPPEGAGNQHIDNMLFLYLSNGVTTIRGMLGHPHHLKLKEQAAKNEILSPRIFTSSPSFNGNSVKTPEEAREKVIQYQKDGYDFLKIHPGVKLNVFEELVKTANKVGIDYAGHVPVDVGIRKALMSQYATIDHTDGYLEGLVAENKGVAPNENGFFGYNFTDLADTTLIDELVQLTRENNVWVVPTQSLFDRWFSPEGASIHGNDPEMKYMPRSTVEKWITSSKSLTENENYNAQQWKKFTEIRNSVIKKLHKGTNKLLLGSDAPQVFNVPGFSIHHEMQGMINAGLTPLEAIQIGTINPAEFFQMSGQFGEIIQEASADLMLLSANPIEDITNLKELDGVFVRGRWLNRESINEKLKEIANYSVDK